MRIKVADITQKVSFVAVDSTDGFARETAISAWTIYYSLNGGTATVMTTPTVAELSAANMPGVYVLTVDEAAMTSAKGELTIHCTATGVAPITRVVEITDNFEADIIADTNDIQARLPAALTAGGNIKSDTLAVSGTAQTAGDLATMITAVDDYVDTEVAAIKTDTAAILLDTGTDGVVVAAASKTGYALSAAGVQAIWDVLTSALITAGSIGKLIVDNLNATISSRSSHTAADVWAVLESAIVTASSIGLKLKTNLDSTVSSRLASSGYTAPDNAGISSTLIESQSHPTLAEIEASPVLAKEATGIAIKAKTDTILWTDITNIKDESLGKWSINKTTNVLTMYKADGVTVLKSFNLTDNASVSERVPV